MKFREFETSSGKEVLAGRSAENNEELVAQVGAKEIVLHTAKPGSGFVNIKGGRVGKKDIYEAGVFCARYSQDWRNNKTNVGVHVFRGAEIFKRKGMKTGTFGVRKFKKIVVDKKDIEGFGK